MTLTATFTVTTRYLVAGEGWKRDEHPTDDLNAAARLASTLARELDRTYGDDHFWTVDIYRDGSSYQQLFHGRLS